MEEPEQIVIAWCEAISRRDKDAFLALCHEAIAFYGPEGTDVGHDVVANWFDTEPMRITIIDHDVSGLTVRLNQRIDWLDTAGGVKESGESTVQIEVRDGKVYSYRRVEEPDAPYAGQDPVVSP